MNQRIILGAVMLVFTIVQVYMHVAGQRGNTILPPLVGAGITLMAGIILLVTGRKQVK